VEHARRLWDDRSSGVERRGFLLGHILLGESGIENDQQYPPRGGKTLSRGGFLRSGRLRGKRVKKREIIKAASFPPNRKGSARFAKGHVQRVYGC